MALGHHLEELEHRGPDDGPADGEKGQQVKAVDQAGAELVGEPVGHGAEVFDSIGLPGRLFELFFLVRHIFPLPLS